MAKVKKQTETVERLLEQTIIPCENPPYKIPDNWRWVTLVNLLSHQAGNSKLIKGKYSSKKSDGLYDAYSAAGQDIYCSKYEHEGDAVVLSAVGARCGKAFLAKGKWSAIANTHVIYPAEGIDVKFLFYRMNDEDWWIRSGSAQPFVSVKETLERPFALPPYEEQKRIVEVVEKQFVKLEEAYELIQKALDSFAERKAAVLHKAFSGELTEKWRAQRQTDIREWRRVLLKDVAKWGSGGTPSRKNEEFYTGEIPWVKTGELNNSYLYDTEEKITEEAIKKSSAKLYPIGTVLMAMYGATIGQCAVLGIPATTNQACACAVVNEGINNKFLFYYLMSQKDEFVALGKGGAQPNISQTMIKNYPIAVPPLEEQEEIVRILDTILQKEDRAKALISMLEKIDEIKSSVLARAYRGELGTNDPTDETVDELVKRILKKRFPTTSKEKGDKIG